MGIFRHQGGRFNGKGGVAFRRPIEINEDLPLIVRKVAVGRREASRINLEADPCLSLVDAPALRPTRRLRAAETYHR